MIAAAFAAVALAVPHWQVVVQHVDVKLADVIGLDTFTSESPAPRALTRRPAGVHDWDNAPVWSPDGQVVAFARFYAHAGLYVVAGTGGAPRLLAHGSVSGLVWSPDGTRLAFLRACPGGSRTCLFVAHVDGRGIRRIAVHAGEVSWSPDGRWLACACGGAIVRLAADGSGAPRRLASGIRPAWSPDGRSIAFERHCEAILSDTSCDLAVVGADGTHTRTLLRNGHPIGRLELSPMWTSLGALLVMVWNGPKPEQGLLLIDPSLNGSHLVSKQLGGVLAAGPEGTFAALVGRTLFAFGADGTLVGRARLPAAALGGDLALHLGG